MSESYIERPRGLYRSRRGMIFGVCRGVADYLNISVFWTRVLVIIAFMLTGFCPVAVVYVLAGLLLKKEPYLPFAFKGEAAKDHADTCRRERASSRLRQACDGLDERLWRMERKLRNGD